ncbi:SRPBCC family protein [Methylobacterium sp. JK268]
MDAASDTDDHVTADCDLPAPPSTVWRALTVPEILAEWLAPAARDPRPGAPLRLDLPAAEGGPVTCDLVEAVPHERLSYRWRDAEGDSVVTFRLTPLPEGGTHLRVVHRPLAARRAGPARPLAMLRPLGRRATPPPVMRLRRAA